MLTAYTITGRAIATGAKLPVKLYEMAVQPEKPCPTMEGYDFDSCYVDGNGDRWCGYFCINPPYGYLIVKA